MPRPPKLSIVIASYNSERTIEACLNSLRNQNNDKIFEIIVVDSSKDKTPALIKNKFPEVLFYHFGNRKYCGDARNIGISKSRGDIIAFIDADCVADKNWANAILEAHQTSNPAIGGAIANGSPDRYTGWAAYFCEFSQWMPQPHPGWMRDIAGANMSYKREVFERWGRFIEGTYCSDTEFHWRMSENGQELLFEPSILVYHQYVDNWPRLLAHEYEHGRFFARVRTRHKGFSMLRRYIYMASFPLIALILLSRIGRIHFKNRIYIRNFLKTLPLIVAGIFTWSFGECMGYAKGGRPLNR